MNESIREATERLVKAVEVWAMARATAAESAYAAGSEPLQPIALKNAEHALQSAWNELKDLARKENRHGRRQA